MTLWPELWGAKTKPRSGPPVLPPGQRLYAIGDVHGHDELLEQLLELIVADAARAPPGERLVVFLGDYIDRGPASHAVVERLRRGPPPAMAGWRWVALRGNHEQMLLEFLEDFAQGANWLHNGGGATVQSYVEGELPNRIDLVTLQQMMRQAIPDEHKGFLAGLPLFYTAGDYLFVHAGMRPGVSLARQTLKDLTSIRGPFLNSGEDFGRVVVHGHTIVERPDDLPNRIGIDTGAFHSGTLTALVAEGDWHDFLHVQGQDPQFVRPDR